jgi:hypothetical protein
VCWLANVLRSAPAVQSPGDDVTNNERWTIDSDYIMYSCGWTVICCPVFYLYFLPFPRERSPPSALFSNAHKHSRRCVYNTNGGGERERETSRLPGRRQPTARITTGRHTHRRFGISFDSSLTRGEKLWPFLDDCYYSRGVRPPGERSVSIWLDRSVMETPLGLTSFLIFRRGPSMTPLPFFFSI